MTFKYKVSDVTGRLIIGEIEAGSEKEALEALRQKNFIVIELTPKKESLVTRSFSLKKTPGDEISLSFFKELAMLLKAGLTIDKALEVLAESHTNIYLKQAISKALKLLKEGKPVSQAFTESGLVKQSIFLGIISAGESIGNLQQAFANIADYLRFKLQLKRDIREALAYPSFLVLSSFISLFVIFHFILPRFFALFEGVALPLSAKLLISLGHFFRLETFALFAVIFIILYFLKKHGYVFFPFHRFYEILLKVPVIKSLMLYLDLARFSYSMHSTLKSGLDFIDALYLSKNLVSSTQIRNLFDNSISEIRRGRSIKEAFSDKALPEIFRHMISVGEESGNLKEVFYEIYLMYDDKFKSLLRKILSLVEPLVITLTGLFIGFIVISLILTVMSIGTIRL